MDDRLVELGQRPLCTVEGVTYAWADVLASAGARGSLEALRTKAKLGLACVERAKAANDEPGQETLSNEATSFRYEHGLLSAEELDQWIGRWSLTVGEWGEYLERKLLLERWAGELDGIDTGSIAEDAVDHAEYVDAVCSGLLEDEANRFAADAALAALPASESDGDRVARAARIAAEAAAARAEAASVTGIEREIANRGLDWTLIEMDMLELADEGVARESALCVRVDGRPLADVAADTGTPVEHVSAYLSDLEPKLQPLLLAAKTGELVGPVEQDAAFLLCAVNGRTLPTPADPELRRRAESTLVDRAVRRALDGKVEWHELV